MAKYLLNLVPLRVGRNNFDAIAKETLKFCTSASMDSPECFLHRLDNISDNVCSFLDTMEYLRANHPQVAIRKAANCAFVQVAKPFLLLNSDLKMYNRLVSEVCAANEEERILVEGFKRDFKIFGLHLPSKAQRETVQGIQHEILRLEGEFVRRSENKILLERLLLERFKLARELGYSSYSSLYLKDKMLNSPQKVESFLQNFPSSSTQKTVSKMKRTLSLEEAMDKICIFYHSFFDLEIEQQESEHLTEFRVHSNGKLIGIIYFDSSRAQWKPHQQPCHYTLIVNKKDTSYFPIISHSEFDSLGRFAVVAVNVPVSNAKFLTVGELKAIMHEFGHAIHACLSSTAFQNTSATRANVDFLEIPALLNELFLPLLGIDVEDAGESSLEEQIQFSRLDQLLHSERIEKYENASSGWLTNVIERFEGNLRNFSLIHLAGYGAGYYSYLFSSQVAGRMWKSLESVENQKGWFCRYKNDFLAVGTVKRPDVLLDKYLQ